MSCHSERAFLARGICFRLLCAMVWLALLSGCGKLAQTPVQAFVAEPFPQKLSDWHLFVGQGDGLQPNQRVLPYDLNTPLFSDYATKRRFVWMPPGRQPNTATTKSSTFRWGRSWSRALPFQRTMGKRN